MVINLKKSAYYTQGIDEIQVNRFQPVWTMDHYDISLGFKYLGFFIKPNLYRNEK